MRRGNQKASNGGGSGSGVADVALRAGELKAYEWKVGPVGV